MDGRPQLERTARRALLGAVVLVAGSTLLGGLLGLSAAAAVIHRLIPKETP